MIKGARGDDSGLRSEGDPPNNTVSFDGGGIKSLVIDDEMKRHISAIQDHYFKGHEDEPFISIHLPFYNEKNVALRILGACLSLDYRNYEVIVVDDSTDETVETLESFKNSHGMLNLLGGGGQQVVQLEALRPVLKIVHRRYRTGFKGGALNEALKHMDPRAKYVVVFDADFIPPPDILHQFLAYFNYNNNRSLNNNRYKVIRSLFNNRKSDEESVVKAVEEWHKQREVAAVQGYQLHILNVRENWITRGIRAEYSGNYEIERTFQQVIGSMRMIAGSVFMIEADVLKRHGWSSSLTEDWELTLRLYEDGYKVVFTPLIQAPAEIPSTIDRLVGQRMRWAEGHTFNVKKHFLRVLGSNKLSAVEKLEFAYYVPYYFQSLLWVIGTTCWICSELTHRYVHGWYSTMGWALFLANFLSLPLMCLAGLYLEGSLRKDLRGVLSFIVLSHLLAPFQAYAFLKGLFERREGEWVRTYKTGKVTDAIMRFKLRHIVRKVLP
ncbi:MAG: glycosyltransferase family 2 protein, partial [Candidatus Bathyarchaeia archaeon]